MLIHGLTNAPKEFAELGGLLHDRGHNVIILRMPYHGLKGLDIKELDPLMADDIAIMQVRLSILPPGWATISP